MVGKKKRVKAMKGKRVKAMGGKNVGMGKRVTAKKGKRVKAMKGKRVKAKKGKEITTISAENRKEIAKDVAAYRKDKIEEARAARNDKSASEYYTNNPDQIEKHARAPHGGDLFGAKKDLTDDMLRRDYKSGGEVGMAALLATIAKLASQNKKRTKKATGGNVGKRVKAMKGKRVKARGGMTMKGMKKK
jgi:hypothetical protein